MARLEFLKDKKLGVELRDIAILIVVGFAMTWVGLSCPNCKDNTRQFIIIGSLTSVLWILLWKGNEYLGTYISTRISWLKFPLRRLIVGIISTIAYTLLVMYLIIATYERTFHQSIDGGMFVSVVITIAISIFMHGREFLLNWKKAALKAEQYRRETMEAKYESLKNQVNPHFLFNSLNALSNLVYEDEDRAAMFIRELSGVYQYVIDIQDKETVPLEDEVRFLESYLFLQQIRFGEKLRVNFLLDGIRSRVAPLALQMLIENAIKHNIVSEDEPLTITLRKEGARIIVENSLQKKTFIGEESAGVGLENIRRRYERLTSESVSVQEANGMFKVGIPLLNE
jgi:sensor histidine kinase YesM